MAGAPITRSERSRLCEVQDRLWRLEPEGRSAFDWLPATFSELFHSDASVIYDIDRTLDALEMGRFQTNGTFRYGNEQMLAEFNALLATAKGDALAYDPTRPAANQRNRVLLMEELHQLKGRPPPVQTQLFGRWGLGDADQLRVLVCEGPVLLAWFGGLRRERFGERDRVLLRELVPALRHRLVLERRVEADSTRSAGLVAALEGLGEEPYLVRLTGGGANILEANALGLRRLRSDRRRLEEEFVASVLGPMPAFTLTPLSIRGIERYALAIRRHTGPTPDMRLRAATQRWSLTPREEEVLGLLVRGKPNRTIALELGCATGTAEIHVKRLLEKSGAQSRSEVAAMFWTLE